MTNDQQEKLNSPIINISGEKISLGPLSKSYLPIYTKWINDFETNSYLAKFVKPITSENEEDWYTTVNKAEDSINFTVFDSQTKKPIGTVGLFRIDHVHKTAELGIMIGDKNYWSKGYGTETVRVMTDYGVTCLGLHNIMLRVYSYNPRAVKAYQNAGFKIVGRLREAKRLAGKRFDIIIMDFLSQELESSVMINTLPQDLM